MDDERMTSPEHANSADKIGVKIAIWATFYALIVVFLLSAIVSIAVFFAGTPEGEILENLKKFSFFVYLGGFFALFLYLRSRSKKGLGFLGFSKRNMGKAVLWGFVWGFILPTLALLSGRIDFSFARAAGNFKALFFHPIGNSYFWFVIAIGPLFEETIGRGLWYNVIREKMPKILAILLISFILTLIHARSAPFFYIQTFIFDIVITILFERIRNIYSPLIAHILYNAITFIFLYK